MRFTLALAQMNPHVGALEENLAVALEMARQARDAGADLLLFPELTLPGYPPEDLLHKPLFLERLEEVEARLREGLAALGIDGVYGSVRRVGQGLYNVGVMVQDGRETGVTAKWRLPNYGVFDEHRYFHRGREVVTYAYRGLRLGITICEDIWHDDGPVGPLAAAGAQLILNLNASPYHVGKQREREKLVARRVAENGLPIAYVNQVGGQDELVFDGGSFAMNADGAIAARAEHFQQQLLLVPVAPSPAGGVRLGPASVAEPLAHDREIYAALVLGLRDYVAKNRFPGVVLGLSGGIDSALTAVVCVDALGAERVEAVMMPTEYTSSHSLEDARELAQRLGIRLANVPIGPMFEVFKRELAGEFAGAAEDVTEENLQPRIRATVLMAISNKKGNMLVTTGNKSEMSVGYATLYGDMAGGFSVLKDVLKMSVFRLSEARNRWAEEAGEPPPIPRRIIDKPPSAELRPDQKDSDSLPPYPVLDEILELYVERDYGLKQLVAAGIDRDTAVRVVRLVDRNEYKRRQAPPGVRITRRAFGKDRRYPITNGFVVA